MALESAEKNPAMPEHGGVAPLPEHMGAAMESPTPAKRSIFARLMGVGSDAKITRRERKEAYQDLQRDQYKERKDYQRLIKEERKRMEKDLAQRQRGVSEERFAEIKREKEREFLRKVGITNASKSIPLDRHLDKHIRREGFQDSRDLKDASRGRLVRDDRGGWARPAR